MLWNEFITNEKKPIHKWTHYFPIYEEVLARYVNRTCTILEIGCFKGGSLQLWKRYLGPYATIVGVDIDPSCKSEESQISIEIGNQSDTNFLEQLVTKYGYFDIIIDDGSHKMSDIKNTFSYLFSHLSKDGVYIVEDLHTAYWKRYEGGLRHKDNFIEYTKTLIDALHVKYFETQHDIEAETLNIANELRSIKIIDSMIVFEKGKNIPKVAPLIGQEAPKDNTIMKLTY